MIADTPCYWFKTEVRQQMKRTSPAFLILLLLSLSTVPAMPVCAQTANPAPAASTVPPNPLKIALLKWYNANTTTSFTVGNEPRGVCFDGANIWVANYGSNTVTKLQASDGSVLGTYNVGSEPASVAFDGANGL